MAVVSGRMAAGAAGQAGRGSSLIGPGDFPGSACLEGLAITGMAPFLMAWRICTPPRAPGAAAQENSATSNQF